MSHPLIVPCLWLNDQAEAAAELYTATFPAGRVIAVSRYPESFDSPGGNPRGSVLTVEIEIGGFRLTVLNGGPSFTPNPSLSFFVRVDTPREADRIFSILAVGGQALMPIGPYPWSEHYGWVQDRFGVSWQVITMPPEDGRAPIVPCVMFTGAQAGRAREAMIRYAAVFPESHLDHLETYLPEEGPPSFIKHGRFTLAGQECIAMDSHIDHGFTFSEGLSLQVLCATQDELDHYWSTLAEGGGEGPCGWLHDRFGLSWQIVPADIVPWMSSEDTIAKDRAFAAMLGMQKLDIAALRAAFYGTSG